MATIIEDYVSFETAKLLKEKGFPQEYDEYHSMVYNEEDYEDEYEVQRMVLETKLVKAGTLSSYPIGVPEPKCYCCTLQMAMKWLREVHGLHISVDACPIYGKVKDEKGKNTCGLLHWHYMASGEWINDKYNPQQKAFVVSEKSYKKAIEAALKYSLENLI